MPAANGSTGIRVAIAGLGNCAGSLVEGISYYRQHPETDQGLLFPVLAGYSVPNIEIVVAFDISDAKVGRPICEAIYQSPNNFVQNINVLVDNAAPVYRGPTFDGNPDHLARFVTESSDPPDDVASLLRDHRADILINLLPTGSVQA